MCVLAADHMPLFIEGFDLACTVPASQFDTQALKINGWHAR